MDMMKTTFLNSELDDDVYKNQPRGFIMLGNEDKLCKLIKTFDESGKDSSFYLYVDDIMIFRTNQVQVDLTKEFLSLRFSRKDIGDVDVIFGIRIKHESNGIAIFQSHYIKEVLKKFNYLECTPVSTRMDTIKKRMPNNGHDVSQLEYFRVIGRLTYTMSP
ncbi:zinc finger, CCHC-type containing protein [Tanacetum coccineum]